MAWKLKIIFSDGSEEIVDEGFDTREDAEAEYESWLENYKAGYYAENDDDDDEYYGNEIEDCEIWED